MLKSPLRRQIRVEPGTKALLSSKSKPQYSRIFTVGSDGLLSISKWQTPPGDSYFLSFRDSSGIGWASPSIIEVKAPRIVTSVTDIDFGYKRTSISIPIENSGSDVAYFSIESKPDWLDADISYGLNSDGITGYCINEEDPYGGAVNKQNAVITLEINELEIPAGSEHTGELSIVGVNGTSGSISINIYVLSMTYSSDENDSKAPQGADVYSWEEIDG